MAQGGDELGFPVFLWDLQIGVFILAAAIRPESAVYLPYHLPLPGQQTKRLAVKITGQPQKLQKSICFFAWRSSITAHPARSEMPPALVGGLLSGCLGMARSFP